MGWFWNVSVRKGVPSHDSNGYYQDYSIVVYGDHRKFFGHDGTGDLNFAALVDHNNRAVRYLGFPIWSSEWSRYASGHSPYQHLRDYDTNYCPPSSPYGAADCDFVGWDDGYVYGPIRVYIDRTNKRKGTKQISVGIRARYSDDSVFGSSIYTTTLETEEIAYPEFSGTPSVSIVGTNIRFTGTYSNPENFYKVQLLKKGTTTVLRETSFTTTSYDFSIPIQENMWGTNQTYIVRLVGKDGTAYRTSSDVIVPIPKHSYKIFAKVAGPTIVSNKNIYFNNNSTKREFKDIYIKVDGQIKKVKR